MDATQTQPTPDVDEEPTMAEAMQAIADAEAEPALTLDEAYAAVDDGSRLAEGADLASIVQTIRDAAVVVVGVIVSLLNQRREVAARVADAARNVLLPNGVPDWGLKSATMDVILQYSIAAALETWGDATTNDKTQERRNILKHYSRTYRELAIRQYVVETTTQLDTDGNVLPMFDEPDDTNALFLAYCRKQYEGAGIGVREMPAKYRSEEQNEALRNGSAGGPGNGRKSPVQIIVDAADAITNVAAQYAVTGLLRIVSNLVGQIERRELKMDGKTDAVAETLDRVSTLAEYGSRLIAYPDKVNADEAENARLCLFDPDADDPDRATSVWNQ